MPAPVSKPKVMPIPFGVDISGKPLPSLTAADVLHIDEDAARKVQTGNHLGLAGARFDANALKQTGWGAVFPHGTTAPAELAPLLDRRKAEAGKLFAIFDGDKGVKPNETAENWLGRISNDGVDLRPVDPRLGVPYYLMLVGPPAQIGFDFQYNLDLHFSAGRLDFENLSDYATYANNIDQLEKSAPAQSKTLALWCVRNRGDVANALLHAEIFAPMQKGTDKLPAIGSDMDFTRIDLLAQDASKEKLKQLLAKPPSLLFTGSHGVAYPNGHADQRKRQGELLCQYQQEGQNIGPESTFAAADLPDSSLNGMIYFLFACYGGGCPDFDTFSHGADGSRIRIAPEPLSAELPRQMLLRGAQAVIAHVDRAWVNSFETEFSEASQNMMRGLLEGLMSGTRAGHAMDAFGPQWVTLSDKLLELMTRKNQGLQVSPEQLADRWTARNDARNYVLIGDPAVRLRTV